MFNSKKATCNHNLFVFYVLLHAVFVIKQYIDVIPEESAITKVPSVTFARDRFANYGAQPIRFLKYDKRTTTLLMPINAGLSKNMQKAV